MRESDAFHKPRKRFGQNFLHDQNVISKMVGSIGARHDDTLVEIGPGQGALTFPLLHKLDRLIAIELDRDLIPALRTNALLQGNLEIYNEDALRFDFRSLTSESHPRLRVVGNLPYNISTPLIFHLLEQSDIIIDMHFLLQKEVVDRMTAAPGSKDFGRLSIMVQYQCKAEKLFHVGPGCFNPPPKVDSAYVRLTPLDKPSLEARNFKHFASLVTTCFGQRRKTLRRILKNLANNEDFAEAGIDGGSRPEQLSVEHFVKLSNQITSHPTNGTNR